MNIYLFFLEGCTTGNSANVNDVLNGIKDVILPIRYVHELSAYIVIFASDDTLELISDLLSSRLRGLGVKPVASTDVLVPVTN